MVALIFCLQIVTILFLILSRVYHMIMAQFAKGVTHMEKFIPYEKLSKKEKKRRNAMQRGSWYGINPVTRKPAHSKAYNRRKAGKWYDPTDLLFCYSSFSSAL